MRGGTRGRTILGGEGKGRKKGNDDVDENGMRWTVAMELMRMGMGMGMEGMDDGPRNGSGDGGQEWTPTRSG
jgi:hypothetical protein